MTDSYYRAWARGEAPPPKPAPGARAAGWFDFLRAAPAPAPAPSLNIRLDVEGGVSYAPGELTPHNPQKRLFVPLREDGSGEPAYDYHEEVRLSKAGGGGSGAEGAEGKGEGQESEAQMYAKRVAEEQAAKGDDDYAADIDAAFRQPQGVGSAQHASGSHRLSLAPRAKGDGASLFSTATGATTRSTATTANLAARQTSTGLLPRSALARMTVAPSDIPASLTGAAASRSTYRTLTSPTQAERERGYSEVEVRAGAGRAPSLAPSNAASAWSTGEAGAGAGLRKPRVNDEFVADPRPWRPLRLVRRSDPGQLLLLTAGVALEPAQAAALAAAQSAAASGADAFERADSAALLAAFATHEAGDVRAGCGVYYCPPPPEASAEHEQRKEVNLSRRMEMPVQEESSTHARAALRSVVAALEYNNWEEEGFDKIVIGTSEWWIVQAITNEIWTWRSNGWVLARESPLGLPGERVPHRDLWELLDAACRAYEKLDFTVRFWLLPRSETRPAKALAEAGALKDTQMPGTVKWRKKKAQAREAAESAAREKETAKVKALHPELR